ncbi:hypothetical protein G6L37_02625 [Agrobacterium rubi]|nr:hypothetical protein [Agrobacterium rubi]NTF24291.1 hypothetical protein [Agrobacterium rubi]
MTKGHKGESMTTADEMAVPHKRVEGMWYHGRPEETMEFDEDRPAFFSHEREPIGFFAGADGYVLEAEIMSSSPCGETDLMAIAKELGLPDVFDEDFSDFPDVSTYLENPLVRRRLEEMGFDSYAGEDGYLYVAVVWNPDLIRKISVSPFSEADQITRPR